MPICLKSGTDLSRFRFVSVPIYLRKCQYVLVPICPSADMSSIRGSSCSTPFFGLHSNPFISLQFIAYNVTGDSVYYSGSLPLVEVVNKLYSANVNIQNVNWTESNVYSPGTWVARTLIYALLGCQQCLYICCGKIIVNNILKFKGVVSLFLMTIMCKV